MWSLKGFVSSRCFSTASGCKDCFPDPRTIEAQMEGKQRIVRVVKAFVLIFYCLALNGFMAYMKHYGVNSVSYVIMAISLTSLVYFIHLYFCEKVDVETGKLRTVRSFFYALAILYIMIMLLCFTGFLLLTERDTNSLVWNAWIPAVKIGQKTIICVYLIWNQLLGELCETPVDVREELGIRFEY